MYTQDFEKMCLLRIPAHDHGYTEPSLEVIVFNDAIPPTIIAATPSPLFGIAHAIGEITHDTQSGDIILHFPVAMSGRVLIRKEGDTLLSSPEPRRIT